MATLSITTTSDQNARILAAFGSRLGLPGPATGPQVKAAIIDHIKSVVHSFETEQAAIAAANAVQPMSDPS